MTRLKQFVKWLLAQFGLVIFKRSSGIYFGDNEIPALALKLCGTMEPFVIDGGTHTGTFVDEIRKSCSRARFLCFEPNPMLASALRDKFSSTKDVQIVQSALGSSCGTAVFNINKSSATSSLAAITGPTTGVLNKLTTTLERIEVLVTTLDQAMSEHSYAICDIIKLDLQGHDLQALKGAEAALKSAKVVIVEVWFTPVYTKGTTFAGIYEFMGNHGFEIYSFAGLHYSTSDRLLWSDAIFVRNDAGVLADPVTIS
jgi:FkbM family methyltransferase